MTSNYKDLMERYIKRIEELSGVKLRFAGCNGEWCSSGFTPWTYLNGYHSRRDICLYLDGIVGGLEYKQREYRRKYGMPIQELRDMIADFTGDKKREAMRKAKIFASHISMRHVSEIVSLSFGKYRRTENGEVVYYGENRDTLHFLWRDLDGDSDTFSIIE